MIDLKETDVNQSQTKEIKDRLIKTLNQIEDEIQVTDHHIVLAKKSKTAMNNEFQGNLQDMIKPYPTESKFVRDLDRVVQEANQYQ